MSKQALTKLKVIDGIEYSLYQPSLFRLYAPCYQGDEIPPYFSRIIHRVRMMREHLKSHYQVVYMKKDGQVLGHLVVARGGGRIAMSGKQDIVIGPIWVVPSQRCHGYASRGIRFILQDMELPYDYAYEFIENDNHASIRTAEKNSFEFVAQCNEYGLFKQIRPFEGGHLKVFRRKNGKA